MMGQFGNGVMGLPGSLGESETRSPHHANLWDKDALPVRFGASMSPQQSTFAPLLFAGRLAAGIEALSISGFDAVEISLRQAADLDIRWLDKRLSDLGLVVSAFATGRICLEDSLCLCDTNSSVRDQLFERLFDLLHLAAHFKASLIIGGVRGRLSGDEQQKSNQRNAAVDTLRQCALIADDLGINLLLEPINRYETNFINTGLDGIELIDTIGHPAIKLLLDTFHMNIEEADPCSTIRTSGRHLGYVHFADNNRHAPGVGHINFPAILAALADIGYQGFITAEILPIPNDEQALLQAGQYFHSLAFDEQ